GIEHDLVEHQLDGLAVFGSVIEKDTGSTGGQLGGGPHHGDDARRGLPLPVWSHHHVETRLAPVSLSNLGELVGARVIQRIDPEAVAEIRHLEDNRFLVQGIVAHAIDHILVRAGDKTLLRADVVGQKRELTDRSHRQDAAHESGLGCLRECPTTVVRADERPAPDVGHATDHLDVVLGHRAAKRRAGNVGCGFGQRYLSCGIHWLLSVSLVYAGGNASVLTNESRSSASLTSPSQCRRASNSCRWRLRSGRRALGSRNTLFGGVFISWVQTATLRMASSTSAPESVLRK